jgi:hypothetical protein
MALGSTQPLTEMSTRNLPGGKGRPAAKADKLIAICKPIIQKVWEPRRPVTDYILRGVTFQKKEFFKKISIVTSLLLCA